VVTVSDNTLTYWDPSSETRAHIRLADETQSRDGGSPSPVVVDPNAAAADPRCTTYAYNSELANPDSVVRALYFGVQNAVAPGQSAVPLDVGHGQHAWVLTEDIKRGDVVLPSGTIVASDPDAAWRLWLLLPESVQLNAQTTLPVGSWLRLSGFSPDTSDL